MSDKETDAEITVIIPFFNAHAYIADALKGLAMQTFQRFFVLIYDDGSTEPFDRQTIAQSGLDVNRVSVWRSEENRGASYAREILLSKVRTPYFAFHDADDVSHPERMELQCRYLNRFPEVAGVGTAIAFVDNTGKFIREEKYPACSYIGGALHGCCATYMMRTDVLANLKDPIINATNCAEDLIFFDRIRDSDSFRNLDKVLYFYRQHSSQNTQSQKYRYAFIGTHLFRRQLISVDSFNELNAIEDINALKRKVYAIVMSLRAKFDGTDVGNIIASTALQDLIRKQIPLGLGLRVLVGVPKSAYRAIRVWIIDAIGRRTGRA